MKIKLIIYLLSLILPWAIRRIYLNKFLGYKISKYSYIGFSLVMSKSLIMDEGARIGNFNIIKNLEYIKLEKFASIGNFNWISGYKKDLSIHYVDMQSRHPAIELEEHSAITNRHFFDCTDLIHIGSYSIIAGNQSQFLTHSIDLELCKQVCNPIWIGNYCFIGTNSVLIKGSIIPDFSIISACTFVNSVLESSYALYGGVPAKKIKDLDRRLLYFSRQIGFVV